MAKLHVRILHDNLTHARYPVLVSHYRHDVIVAAEKYLDDQLDGRLSELLRMELYAGPINTGVVVLNEPPPGDLSIHPGAIAAENADSIIWFDQHGDINTPETSAYGFLDGMALATALGLCWRPMANTIPGFQPVDPAKCMLVDARDLDPDEKALLDQLPIIRAEVGEAADKVVGLKETGVRRTHLHIDLDVHDPDELQVNRYARPGGPQPDALREAASCMARSAPIVGLTLSAYDPAYDAKGEVPPAVGRLMVDFLAALERI